MKTAKISITYEFRNGLNQNMFVLKISGAWSSVQQFASTPEMALWKVLGMSDGLYAAGYSTLWEVSGKTQFFQPGINELAVLLDTENE